MASVTNSTSDVLVHTSDLQSRYDRLRTDVAQLIAARVSLALVNGDITEEVSSYVYDRVVDALLRESDIVLVSMLQDIIGGNLNDLD